MPKRRKVLIGLGGTIALAGCSGDTGTEEEPTEQETDTPTETATEEPTPTETEEPTPTQTEQPEQNVYEIGEWFIVDEDNIGVTVTETRSGYSLGSEEADGIFQVFEMEIENLGEESVELGFDNFKMEDSEGRRYEGDRNLSFVLEDSISSTWESINPGITTLARIGFDVPEDREIPYFVVISGVFTGNEEEAYKVRYRPILF